MTEMIGHRGPRGLVALAVLGLVGCASSVSTLDRRYRCLGWAGRTSSWDTPAARAAETAPPSAAGIARPLASADDWDDAAYLRPKNTGWVCGPLFMSGDFADWLQGENYEAIEYIGKDEMPWFYTLGYQFEILRGTPADANGVVQIVPMIVGLDKSIAMPALNVLVGVRHVRGWEVACGAHYMPRPRLETEPEATGLSGLGFVASIGYTFGSASPDINGPRVWQNLGVVCTEDSLTYSLTIGWGMAETALDQILGPLAPPGEDRSRHTGWRMGMAYVTGELADWLQGENDQLAEYIGKDEMPCFFVLGYQFDVERGGPMDGARTFVQIVPAVAGLDQNMFIPMLNAVAGLRFPNGFEYGVGLQLAPRVQSDYAYHSDDLHLWGLGLTVGFGRTFVVNRGADNETRIPINLAVGFAADATIYSVTIGWNMRKW